jgi:galactokinase
MITSEGIKRIFANVFGRRTDEAQVTKAPGRVNLIGEHTDYNDGFVLPTPISRHVWAAAAINDSGTANLYAVDYDERASFDLNDIRFDAEHGWANYVMGVAWALLEEGHSMGGVDLAISGDVPVGAGLSSSAAIEVAVARMFVHLFSLEIDPVELAYIGKRAENEFVGVQSGIMDQFVGSLGRLGEALFIDCRTDEYQRIPMPDGVRFFVVNTMVRRELQSSAYNERRLQCEEGVRMLRKEIPNVQALRDVSLEELERFRGVLPDVIMRRCSHVVSENNRVIEAVKAFREDDVVRFGTLMYDSHASLRYDYEVSCRELDVLVEAAKGIRGTLGARMTGAGFGGCTVNMVEEDRVPHFAKEIIERYSSATGSVPDVYMV